MAQSTMSSWAAASAGCGMISLTLAVVNTELMLFATVMPIHLRKVYFLSMLFPVVLGLIAVVLARIARQEMMCSRGIYGHRLAEAGLIGSSLGGLLAVAAMLFAVLLIPVHG